VGYEARGEREDNSGPQMPGTCIEWSLRQMWTQSEKKGSEAVINESSKIRISPKSSWQSKRKNQLGPNLLTRHDMKIGKKERGGKKTLHSLHREVKKKENG